MHCSFPHKKTAIDDHYHWNYKKEIDYILLYQLIRDLFDWNHLQICDCTVSEHSRIDLQVDKAVRV